MGDRVLEQLINAAERGAGAREVADLLQKVTGVTKVGEVFTVRDWQACNELALGAYPEATHICYGDSVGVYLPRGFMSPRRSPWSRVAARLRRWRQSKQDLLANPRVDINYLLLPGAFGMPPGGEVVRTQATTLRDLFGSLAPLLDGAALEGIRQKTAGRPVWVLLGSNFSEQGLMTPEAEASAYRDWIGSLHPEPGSVLLIKSHPRDHQSKRTLLEKQLLGLFDEVWCADAVGSAYLPVEVLLLELASVVGSLRCLTVSTACLGTRFVVESKTDIGLGDALVLKYMVPDRQEQRMQHERDLRRLCAV
ncbi:polysialyltransferase family glycosyltransferase [Hydrogenophaga sp.]